MVIGASGNSYEVHASRPSNTCAFTAAGSQTPWIQVISTADVENVFILIRYGVEPNTGATRSGSIVSQGKTVTIRQLGAVNSMPTLSVTHQPAGGMARRFVVTATDTEGAQDLRTVELLIGPVLGKNNVCLVRYNAIDNTIWLFTNDGENAEKFNLTDAGPSPLENSQCSLDRSSTSVVASGTTLTITSTITFTPTFVGI